MKPDDAEQEIDSRGWDAITKTFERLYPGQNNPLHYGTLIPWQLGGNDPLRGISVYDGGDYWHFVSYGLSDLYEKETNDPEWSGYGFEFTLKLKKAGLADENAEIKTICGIFQALARLTFQNGEIFQPNEYIYTGQTEGMDNRQQSKLTGFITALDEAGEIVTPNGRVQFVKLIGATDAELKALCNKETTVPRIAEMIGSDLTDYTRVSVL
ncbi:MAG: branched-chain alpha-keto acid dehydrogenase subunit E2 [Clostridiales bacterium 41_12_two_minus]|nr:MAG: branched-chain alpha-keto acid dehydrogenase subunit E2 [Clostridiales bacterium 41_12_two_minus]